MTINNINNFNQEELKYAYHLYISDSSCSLLDIENVVNQCENLNSLSITHEHLTEFSINLLNFIKLRGFYLQMPKLSSLEGICLPKIEYLVLRLESLQSLKASFLPESLIELRINSSSLNQIRVEDIAHLTSLKSIEIQAPIQKMFSLKHCQLLGNFILSSTLIDDLSEKNNLPNNLYLIHICYNKQLKVIDLKQFNQLERLTVVDNHPEMKLLNIQSCISLTEVHLDKVNDLPEGIEQCQQLISLWILSHKFEELPDVFLKLTLLKSLRIVNTPLKKVPQDWRKMQNLESLYLNNNQIEDFSFAYTIPNLKSLNLNDNPIKDKLFFFEGTKILPIESYTEGLFRFKPLPHKETLSFMSALAKSGLNRADKEWFFNAFKDLQSIEITEGWSIYRLVQGLFIHFKSVSDKITTELQKRDLNKLCVDTFSRGTICFLDGTFLENKNEIKDKLKFFGINVSSQFNDTVTHIILGKRPKESLKFYENNELPYLLEHQLYGFIKDVGQEDKFLVQEAAAGESVMADSLKQLLASTDANMVQIGLEMLKTGGVTEGVFDELLLLNKTFNDAKVRAETKRILIKQGSTEWVGVLNDRQTFVDIQNARGKEIRDKLEKMAKSVDKSAVFAFAMLIFKYHQKGLTFVLANFGTNSDERKAALLALTDRTYFDFHTGVGYHNWKNKRPEEVILSPVKTGIAFPIDHPKAKEIRAINMHNCKFDTLSKDITVFENLEELDLSVNNLKSLPIQIGKLTKLKKLDLSFNRLTTFPAALENLSQLEYLDLRHNDANAFKSNLPTAIEIPQTFANKLPNCVVLL